MGLYTDGSSTTNGVGAGIVLQTLEGRTIEYTIKFQFQATNNEAEYETAITGLQLCRSLKVKRVRL